MRQAVGSEEVIVAKHRVDGRQRRAGIHQGLGGFALVEYLQVVPRALEWIQVELDRGERMNRAQQAAARGSVGWE